MLALLQIYHSCGVPVDYMESMQSRAFILVPKVVLHGDSPAPKCADSPLSAAIIDRQGTG